MSANSVDAELHFGHRSANRGCGSALFEMKTEEAAGLSGAGNLCSDPSPEGPRGLSLCDDPIRGIAPADPGLLDALPELRRGAVILCRGARFSFSKNDKFGAGLSGDPGAGNQLPKPMILEPVFLHFLSRFFCRF